MLQEDMSYHWNLLLKPPIELLFILQEEMPADVIVKFYILKLAPLSDLKWYMMDSNVREESQTQANSQKKYLPAKQKVQLDEVPSQGVVLIKILIKRDTGFEHRNEEVHS